MTVDELAAALQQELGEFTNHPYPAAWWRDRARAIIDGHGDRVTIRNRRSGTEISARSQEWYDAMIQTARNAAALEREV